MKKYFSKPNNHESASKKFEMYKTQNKKFRRKMIRSLQEGGVKASVKLETSRLLKKYRKLLQDQRDAWPPKKRVSEQISGNKSRMSKPKIQKVSDDVPRYKKQKRLAKKQRAQQRKL